MPDQRTCSYCSPTRPRTRTEDTASERRPRHRPPVRRHDAPQALNYRFSAGGRTLELTGDLRLGWRHLDKVWGFSEIVRIKSLAERDVRVRLMLLPRWGADVPRSPRMKARTGPLDTPTLGILFTEDWRWLTPAELEELGYRRRKDGKLVFPSPIRFSVQADQLTVYIDLLEPEGRFDRRLTWRLRRDGVPVLQRQFNGFEAVGSSRFEFAIQVRIQAQPQSLRPAPVSRAWLEAHFVPGGLPSLGKRR